MREMGSKWDRRRHSLFLKVFCSYGIIIAAFAAVVGVIFIQLYVDATMDSYQMQLRKQAESIAARVSEFVQDDDYITYPSYLEVLEELETADIWILPNPAQPMDLRYANMELTEEEALEVQPVLQEVFEGRIGYRSVYSETYDANYVFVGAPILDVDGRAVGAVLVNSLAESQKDVINQSLWLIIASVIMAIVISFVIAFLLAGQISRPISRMRYTALELAQENYDIHTELDQGGEIGELAGAIDILADRLRETDEQRKNMEQMRQDFFANVSHELRTPITVIRAYTESLVDGVVTDSGKVGQYYERMLAECKSMERLVGDLLVLSKMQNPDFQVEKEPINLLQVFEDILRSAKAISQRKQIKIRMETIWKGEWGSAQGQEEEPVCLMMGDYDRIRQMFMVILDNAIKFSDEGGVVEIGLEADGYAIMASIRDHGIGIAPDEVPYIFDKFYKSKLRQNAKGSGLGLAIAKQIAIKHDGRIEVDSSLKEGTTFYFYLKQIREDEL